ncbi:MAG: phosphatase PAP2 family protein [Deltaproteobacteria bacterium]|jgi:membrane-associated phospholipid phosphatase|nr:phosphatase PAP2 family protein [Deltaproteobacteria bacterium]MBW2469410.1 phosphatase PAP2 family protein [Deltaproteobacteria bacterium]MBW2516402.1 phosphatase PAP2 family protein [Deltaproteobacteria bacterium]
MSESSEILDWGITVVRWLQQYSPGLDLPFKTLTFLGNLEFFLFFMPLFYWCLDRRRGARLLVLFLISAYINSIAKVIASQPRPFQYDPGVKALVHAGGGGFPSGHTQAAVVVWGFIAAQVKKPSMWILAGFLMMTIPLSRLYLGVHFPTDLFGGYLIGAVLLTAYLLFASKIEAGLVKRGIHWQMAAAIGLPIGLILLSPAGARTAVTAGSVLLGFAPGMILERRRVRFDCGGSTLKRSLRFVVGMVVVVALWAGLRIAFSALTPAVFFQILRYALIGLWCAWGAPWLFVRFRLAETE